MPHRELKAEGDVNGMLHIIAMLYTLTYLCDRK